MSGRRFFSRLNRRLWLGLLPCLLHTGALAAPPTPVIVAEALTKPFADRIEALGTLSANESVALTATVTETISVLHFDDGQRVPAGTVLVEMTSEEEHAQLTEATARVREAQRQHRRVQSLATQGTAAKALLDERGRELETAQAQLVAIESRLSDRLIKAPFAGVVGLRNISVGALVEPGDVITTLDDDSVMKLDLTVPSVFLGALRTGLDVVATTRAYRERSFRGSVHSVDSRVDPVTRSIVVRVRLPNPDRLLKPGMLMRVTLVKNPRSALAIPESALMPLGREQFVLQVVEDGDGYRVERRQVRIGARRPGEVEVLDGLAEGDRVVTHGAVRVRPGQSVEVRAVETGTEPLTDLLRGKPTAAVRDQAQ